MGDCSVQRDRCNEHQQRRQRHQHHVKSASCEVDSSRISAFSGSDIPNGKCLTSTSGMNATATKGPDSGGISQPKDTSEIGRQTRATKAATSTDTEKSLPRASNSSPGVSERPDMTSASTTAAVPDTSQTEQEVGGEGDGTDHVSIAENEWCECSRCHSREFNEGTVSPTSQTAGKKCPRCTGCGNGSRTNCPPSLSSPNCPPAHTLPVPRVRLKVVYYHNRFVAVPVQSLQPFSSTSASPHSTSSSVAGGSTSSARLSANQMASSSSNSPHSVAANLSSSSKTKAATLLPQTVELDVVDEERLIRPRQTTDGQAAALRGNVETKSGGNVVKKPLMRRIIECLEDRDADADDGPLLSSKDGRRRATTSTGQEQQSEMFDMFVKSINICFLVTGLLLFVGVVVVIICTTFIEIWQPYNSTEQNSAKSSVK